VTVQVYGQFCDYLSISNVSRSICTLLDRANVNLYVWGLGNAQDPYLNCDFQTGMTKAPIAIAIGYPPEVSNCLIGHQHKILVTVCETDQIPNRWVTLCNQFEEIYVPSAFCKQAFENSGVRTQVSILRHGIAAAPLQTSASTKYRAYVHFAGSVSFARRKGTVKLLRAWKAFQEKNNEDVYLHVYSPVPERLQQVVDTLEAPKVSVRPPLPRGLAPLQMARLLQYYIGLIAPSRAEGFGILPLEARCCGVPVAMTAVTGHAEHFVRDVDVKIETDAWEFLDTQGNTVGKAPAIYEEAILDGIERLHYNIEEHTRLTREWAEKNRTKWSWREQAAPFVRHVKSLNKKFKQPLVLGGGIGNG